MKGFVGIIVQLIVNVAMHCTYALYSATCFTTLVMYNPIGHFIPTTERCLILVLISLELY